MLQILIAALTLVGAHAGAKKMDLGQASSELMAAKKLFKKENFGAEELKKWPHTIQVAAYLSEEDAIEHVKELSAKREKNTFYYSTFIRGQIWYKVCVGRYENPKQAERYQREFIKKHDEPFSTVVSLNKGIDTGSEKKMRIASAKKLSVVDRTPASTPKAKPVIVKKTKVNKVAAMKPSGNTAKSMNKYYSLQVAAFSVPEEAQKHLDSFTKKGHNGHIVQAMVDGKRWYRVLIGHFTTYSSATAFKDDFSKTNKVQGLVRKFTN